MKTPAIWMEARCASVASITSDNWEKAAGCHETALDGGFFTDIRRARLHFGAQGWRIIDGEWWCPCCAEKLLKE
jgi:hypothetical protein